MAMDLSNFENICRTCMTDTDNMLKSIFLVDIEFSKSIADMISDCSSTVVRDFDGLPLQICTGCESNLKIAYRFRLKCDASFYALQDVYKKCFKTEMPMSEPELDVKLENFDVSFDAKQNEELDLEENDADTTGTDIDEPQENVLVKNEKSLNISKTGFKPKRNDRKLDKTTSKTNAILNLKQIGITYETLHEDDGTKKYQCKVCEKIFAKTFHIRRHLFVHSPYPKPYKCDKCDKTFGAKDHLKRHSDTHLENKARFVCDYCGNAFSRIDYLRTHIVKHIEYKPEKLKKERSRQKEFKCRTCVISFKTKSEYQEHYKIHLKENVKFNLCPECGVCYKRRNNFLVHLQRHKGIKPFQCKFCPKSFPRSSDCVLHEKYHTEAKEHVCSVCQKGFYRQYDLKVHMRIHTGERPYQCPHCPKSYAQGNDLKVHIRRHTGEKFKCEICGQDFWHKYQLTNHKRNEHGLDVKSHISRVQKVNPQVPESL